MRMLLLEKMCTVNKRNIKRFKQSLLLITLLNVLGFHANICVAYEFKAHMRFARVAAQRSVLSDNEFADGMGFECLAKVDHEVKKEECDWRLKHLVPNNVIDNIYCGAEIEDELPRPLNHFYDPVYNVPLISSPPLFYMGVFPISIDTEMTPDWALEDNWSILSQNFSLNDAMDHLLDSYRLPTYAERYKYRVIFFQALGMVMHLVEDMASPEHVRGDQHLYPESQYEKYTDVVVASKPLSGFDYPAIDLNYIDTARDLFVNVSQNDMSGLSSFTNSNFISADTNFVVLGGSSGFAANRKYSLPAPNQTLTKIPASDLYGSGVYGTIWFVSSDGNDEYLSKAVGSGHIYNERASALSLYSRDLQDLQHVGSLPHVFTVNSKTFDSAHDFLLKRAISYSSGLVDYFFRGRFSLENVVVSPKNGSVNSTVSVLLKNTSGQNSKDGAVFDFVEGDLKLYYDSKNGERLEADTSGLTSVFNWNNGEELDRTFVIDNASWDRSKPLTLTFDGIIGNERGIAAREFFPEPLLAFNVDGITGNSTVQNTVKVYASYDMGYSWKYTGGFAMQIDDTSVLNPDDAFSIYSVVSLGDGSIMALVDYRDFVDDDWFLLPKSTSVRAMVKSDDYGKTWSVVDFNIDPLIIGSANESDLTTVLDSLVFTGNEGLVGVRVQHPSSSDPSGTPRSFQIYHSDLLGQNGSWMPALGYGVGGHPEVDYLGDSSFVFSSYLEGYDTGPGMEGGDFLFDTILSRTDNGGGSYYPLPEFTAECGDPDDLNNSITYCVQHVVVNGPKSLIGWVDKRAERLRDYSKDVNFYHWVDGGAIWLDIGMNAPFDEACKSIPDVEPRVEDLLYIGSTPSRRYYVAQTSCTEIVENSSHNISTGTGFARGLFFSRNDGETWTQVRLPPGYTGSGKIIYSGDNGAIEGLYETTN